MRCGDAVIVTPLVQSERMQRKPHQNVCRRSNGQTELHLILQDVQRAPHSRGEVMGMGAVLAGGRMAWA